MIKASQAVILCGGLGTRLRPLTNHCPKPMIPVNGKPFLEYLLIQLKEKGITNVVLLTGYLGDQIRDYFNNGDSLGMYIQYSHGTVKWNTGKRLFEAIDILDDYFLLLYSDNFVQYDLTKLHQLYNSQKKALCFTITKKENGNIRLQEDGAVKIYDKTRSLDKLEFVELGYMIINKLIIKPHLKDNDDFDFSEVLFKLVQERQVSGYIVEDAYYSVSDPERLKLVKQYLTQKKIILLDRDGTINQKAPRGEYIEKWDDFKFIPETLKGLKTLSQKGFKFIVISNQAGIGRGIMTVEQVAEINNKMGEYLNQQDIEILDVFVCPHHWEDNCKCRKPNPGMFFSASKKWCFRLDKSYYIGDDPRDCQAAFNAGCKSIFLGLPDDLKNLTEDEQPCSVFDNFENIANYIIGQKNDNF